ncbi:hypothetical protein HN371_14545 [Candidatus Poribacteria bacterium]|jgi:hypothetical protein|nr:hypothetical protein [Candidatus Poribacteria bacterium]MBT5536305.1 hypothetical protein [Candidatus Poribacteria bacterium]MBT5715184.1 hypothetical protein [Candidatus Poribacteria bacterium]MBT7096513.1 hypothetical protein [Candidatus Poribacteria bacterium]MBT7803844.1 hypothetical protein [Candidatus Poribacteria bacterium]
MRCRITTTTMWCLATAWFVAQHVLAQDTLIAPRVGAAPAIDGEPDDWQLSLFTADAYLALDGGNGNVNAGAIGDRDDYATTTYVAYDDDMLYVLVVATDDAIESGFGPDNNWENDCVELWIDGRDNDGVFPGEDDNVQVNVDVNGVPMVYRDAGGVKAALLPEVLGGSIETANGWIIETAIPLGIVPDTQLVAGGQIGFNISFVDSDDGVWNHLLWLGDQEVNTAQWGTLAFSSDTLAVDAAGKLATTWSELRR